jgi:hypothetical protein
MAAVLFFAIKGVIASDSNENQEDVKPKIEMAE